MLNETTEALQHVPLRPPRKDVPREAVYAGRWQELMGTGRRALERVLADCLLEIGQREATVAASVITWLGCNMGQALLDEAQRRLSVTKGMFSYGGAASDAHLCAWHSENRRKHGINYGWRTLEAILVPDLDEVPQGRMARPSTADYEVAEQVMFWLGSAKGQVFLTECQAEVRVLNEIESLAALCRLGCHELDRAQELLQKRSQWETAGKVAAQRLSLLVETHGAALGIATAVAEQGE